MAGQGSVTQEQMDQLRRELGLDLPLWRQYLRFLAGLARGDLGHSVLPTGGRPSAGSSPTGCRPPSS